MNQCMLRALAKRAPIGVRGLGGVALLLALHDTATAEIREHGNTEYGNPRIRNAKKHAAGFA